jgi:hypothetical protein
LLGLLFDPEDGGDVPPKRQLTFTGLDGGISQKREPFTASGESISYQHERFKIVLES